MRRDSPLEQRIRARIAALGANGLLRTLREPAGIDLSSNDYLNLSKHPVLATRLIEGTVREGCGSTGSRLLRGERECFAEVERRFARFKGAERALYFSTGYLANIGVLTTLAETGDVIFSDRRNHASLIDGMRLSRARAAVFPHNDVRRLERLLAGSSESGVRFVVVESLFSMDGDVAPLAEYAALCRSSGAVLVVDEAHAVGIYGGRGSGLMEAAGIDHENCISINTAGKALGVAGAFVAGPSWAVEYLVQRARPFVFSTAPPPALADALDASLTIVAEEPERRERLLVRAAYLRARLAAAGIGTGASRSQIHPNLHRRERPRRRGGARHSGRGLRCARHPAAQRPGRHGTPAGVGECGAVRSDARSIRRCAGGRAAGGRTLFRGVFVTGTDTGVGKTVVCAALMHRYRSLGSRPDTGRITMRYWKPVQTGIERDDDTREVRRLGGCSPREILLDGVRLRRPLSPHLAARLSGVTISVATLLDGACSAAAVQPLDRRRGRRRPGSPQRVGVDDGPHGSTRASGRRRGAIPAWHHQSHAAHARGARGSSARRGRRRDGRQAESRKPAARSKRTAGCG